MSRHDWKSEHASEIDEDTERGSGGWGHTGSAIPSAVAATQRAPYGRKCAIIEACCGKNSKMGRVNDPLCEVVRITEYDDLTSEYGYKKAAAVIEKYGKDTLLWCSIPCTGGRPTQMEP